MDQICPRCGCRSFHYNRSRMRVECDACGHALTDPQALQLQREAQKLEKQTRSREQREEEKQRRFTCRQQKRKEKHRGK